MTNRSFQGRHEAGEELATSLDHYRNDSRAIVLGLPRGGVVVAAAISEALKLPLDVFITRKLRAPCDRECALGAVTETGGMYIDQNILCAQNCSHSDLRAYMEHEIAVQRAEIVRQKHLFRKDQRISNIAGKLVIVVDDGVATGSTFFAAVDALRKLGAGKIVGAIPVVPADVVRRFGYAVDELTVLLRPEDFVAVSDHYTDFRQISDEEVARLLERKPSFSKTA